ncbi:hypothetical protein GDO78_019576 [Eleutherodactylus coqui]|uniref:Ig-like domain-containing protein n=1 Tax=Eleutherodactylus coqui TaxID=57060 RepID=A0A8J6BJA2_ELECQ|nr:hypothetical protein GDO78_019576 [Eleutherodactylus coqui]
MSCFFLLLSLVLYCAYASAQFTVTQDASVSASPGGTVRLTCSRSGGSVTGSQNYPSWYYQTPGSPPKLLVYSSSSTNQNTRPSEISDRYSGAISAGSAVLSISKVQSTDEGVYYCLLFVAPATGIYTQ